MLCSRCVGENACCWLENSLLERLCNGLMIVNLENLGLFLQGDCRTELFNS